MGNHKYFEYPIDDDAFLFSLDIKEYFRLEKGKIKFVGLIVMNLVFASMEH